MLGFNFELNHKCVRRDNIRGVQNQINPKEKPQTEPTQNKNRN